jgi:hypothetical protein
VNDVEAALQPTSTKKKSEERHSSHLGRGNLSANSVGGVSQKKRARDTRAAEPMAKPLPAVVLPAALRASPATTCCASRVDGEADGEGGEQAESGNCNTRLCRYVRRGGLQRKRWA